MAFGHAKLVRLVSPFLSRFSMVEFSTDLSIGSRKDNLSGKESSPSGCGAGLFRKRLVHSLKSFVVFLTFAVTSCRYNANLRSRLRQACIRARQVGEWPTSLNASWAQCDPILAPWRGRHSSILDRCLFAVPAQIRLAPVAVRPEPKVCCRWQ